MKQLFRSPHCIVGCLAALISILGLRSVHALENPPSAKDLSAQLSAAVLDNSSTVRLKLEIPESSGNPKAALQLLVKARRTKAASEIIYQLLWPKERKGESFLLRKPAGQAPGGTLFLPPDTLKPLSAAEMQRGVFGSALAYEDLVDNFFAWEHQSIVGTETIDRVECIILESKPGKSDRSSYASVRSWIDLKRLVPLRVEKHGASGQLICRIITTRVAKDDTGRSVPASLSVQRAGTDAITTIEGSNSRHDVSHSDADFTPEALRVLASQGGKIR